MGLRTHADICTNFLQLSKSIGFKGDDSLGQKFNEWICVNTCYECGSEGNLYGSLFIKTNEYDDIEDIYDLEDIIFEEIKYPNVYLVFSGDGDNIGSIFSDKIEYTTEFKNDFGIDGEIKNQKAFSQTI